MEAEPHDCSPTVSTMTLVPASSAQLTDRLDLLDPRFDPFLRTVSDFFTVTDLSGHSQNLIYLRTDLPPAGLLLRLFFASPATVLTVLDFDVRKRLLAAALMSAMALIGTSLLLAAGNLIDALDSGAMVVPWLIAILNSGGVAVIAAAAVLLVLRDLTRGSRIRAVLVISLVSVATLFLFGVFAALVGSIWFYCRRSFEAGCLEDNIRAG